MQIKCVTAWHIHCQCLWLLPFSSHNSSISPVDSVQGIHHGSAVQEPIGGANITTHVGLLSFWARVADREHSANQPVTRHITKLLVVVGILALGAAARALEADTICSGSGSQEDSLGVQARDALGISVKTADLVRQITFC